MRCYYLLGGYGGVKTYFNDDFTIDDLIAITPGETHIYFEYNGATFLSGFNVMVNEYDWYVHHCDTGICLEHIGEYVAFINDNSKYIYTLGYNGGKYLFSTSDLHEFFKMLFDYVISIGVTDWDGVFNIGWCRINSYSPFNNLGEFPLRGYYNSVSFNSDFIYYPSPCCYPDFAPIANFLGGFSMPDQLENLKIICQILGIDSSSNGLSDCILMNEYLKRIVQNLGGTSLSEPNENLKSICYLLGVDTSENGLSNCTLSKDYIKRINLMLGAE